MMMDRARAVTARRLCRVRPSRCVRAGTRLRKTRLTGLRAATARLHLRKGKQKTHGKKRPAWLLHVF